MMTDADPPEDEGPIGLDETVTNTGHDAEPPTLVEFAVPPALYDIAEADDDLTRGEPSTLVSLPTGSIPILAAIETLGQTLGGRLDALATRFDREIRAESTREKVVDRLHAELQEYKGDLLLNTLRPVFVDLIQLHDDVGKLRPSEASEDPGDRRLIQVVGDVQQAIEDILYRQGVEPFTLPDASFDPKRQRAVSTISTDEAGLAKTVAFRLRKGFVAGEKVIRPEIVSVYVHKPK